MGWTHIPGDRLDPDLVEDCERGSRREVILQDRLKRRLKDINPEFTEDTIAKAVSKITHIQEEATLEANRLFHSWLIAGLAIEQDIGARRQNVTVRFIDFNNSERNDYLAVSQFWVREHRMQNRPDIVLFINGIPLVVIECKSPVARDKGIAAALGQLVRYQREIPRLFRTNELLIGCNLFGANYGTIEAPADQYHEWEDSGGEKLPDMAEHPSVREMLALGLIEAGDLGSRPTMQEVLLAGLCNRQNLLDIIQNFIVFDYSKEEHKRVKKICRYQQYSAVNGILKRVVEERNRTGIIWHWQGCGKSLIMLFAAVKLRREEEKLKNPVILIVTDRIKLDSQIAETFKNCDFPNPKGAESMSELYSLLGSGIGYTITTTVQKFRQPLKKPLSLAENIIILTDEAHRTQYGHFALNMRKALPKASFFAFTGTPLDKRDRNTYRHFSPYGERYLDRYDMKQSLEDHATVPLRYESRLATLQIVGNTLDELIRNLFPEKSPKELAEIKRRYATLDAVLGAPKRIERIALDIVTHFNDKIAPNGFKVMIVASERKTAVMYKKALDKLIDPSWSAVVITLSGNDPKEWKENYRLTSADEDRLTGQEVFQDSRNKLKFLIVCDKLLTGFDAPILQVLYLDQRMKEHTLLQAAARPNRPCRRKNIGLVVDYLGVGRELAEALSIFEQEDIQGFLGVNDTKAELASLSDCHRRIMSLFQTVPRSGEPQDILQRFLEFLRPEDRRNEFEALFREFARSMDFLMPDPCVQPVLEDFKLLGAVREGARNLYRDERMDLEKCSRKVENLIHAHIADTGIEEILAPVDISSPDFEEKLNLKGTSRIKASHVEYALRETISTRVAEDPQHYESLRQKLDQLITDEEQRRRNEAEFLKNLIELKRQDDKRTEVAAEKGLSLDELAFYGLFESQEKLFAGGEEQRRLIAREIVKAIESLRVIDWSEKEDIQREMRRKVKDCLRAAGFPFEILELLAREVLELARARFKDS